MRNTERISSVKSGSANLEFMKQAINYNSYVTYLISQNLTTGSNILDFGAGSGEFTRRLSQQGFEITALEVEDNLITNLKDLGFNTLNTLADSPNKNYTHIYSLNVLEHIENDAETIKLLASKLQPNGTLILYVPAFEILFSEMDTRVGHFRRYTKKSIQQLINSEGLKIERIHFVDFLGFFATLVYKLFPNQDGAISLKLLRLYDSFIFPLNKFFDCIFGRYCGKNIFVVARKKL